VLAAARFAADAVVFANDAALALADGSGSLTVNLVAQNPPPPLPSLVHDGIGRVRFGEDADQVMAYLSETLGVPTDDSGWYDTGYDPNSQDDQCHSPVMRIVSWANLSIVFAEYDPALAQVVDRRTFVAYRYRIDDSGADLLGLKTDRGLRLGDEPEHVRSLYPASTIDLDWFFEPGEIDGWFSTSGTVSGLVAGTDLCRLFGSERGGVR
jgi:hypothetical protein